MRGALKVGVKCKSRLKSNRNITGDRKQHTIKSIGSMTSKVPSVRISRTCRKYDYITPRASSVWISRMSRISRIGGAYDP